MYSLLLKWERNPLSRPFLRPGLFRVETKESRCRKTGKRIPAINGLWSPAWLRTTVKLSRGVLVLPKGPQLRRHALVQPFKIMPPTQSEKLRLKRLKIQLPRARPILVTPDEESKLIMQRTTNSKLSLLRHLDNKKTRSALPLLQPRSN